MSNSIISGYKYNDFKNGKRNLYAVTEQDNEESNYTENEEEKKMMLSSHDDESFNSRKDQEPE